MPGICCLLLRLVQETAIRYIQAMLGHAQLSTTQIYTQVSIKKLQQIHELTHPADRPPSEDEEAENATDGGAPSGESSPKDDDNPDEAPPAAPVPR